MNLKNKLCSISFSHISKSRNHFADALATLASMLKIPGNVSLRPIDIETKDDPTHCINVEKELDGKLWYYDVKKFLQERVYPACATAVHKKTIRCLACQA